MRLHVLLLIQALTKNFVTAQPKVSSYLRADEGRRKVNSEKVTTSEKTDKLNCIEGCDLSKTNPVCGNDDISYQNNCLAFCQNIAIKSSGECPGDVKMNNESYDTTAQVSISDMNRFKDDGFVFVAKRKFVQFTDEPLKGEEIQSNPGDNQHMSVHDDMTYVRRVTNDGNEYMKKMFHKDVQNMVENKQERRLGIFKSASDARGIVGKDSRKKICMESCYPYSAIGEFDSLEKQGGCTGTVISSSTVLTAAHCLYKKGNYTNLQYFAPGRYRNTQGKIVNPYKVWKIEFVTLFSNWITEETLPHDIALAHFSKTEDTKENIGDVSGYIGISMTTNDSEELQSATVIGYQNDKEDGELWTSGKCDGGFQKGFDDVITYHKCDSVKGNAGSPLIDLSRNVVYGVNVPRVPNEEGYPDDYSTNVGVLVHQSNVGSIMSIAGGISQRNSREPL